jgi:diguanylate cyclase (GGDEF)-like protein
MTTWRHRIKPRVFVVATAVTAAVLLGIVAVPQWFSKQARLDVLRSHVAQIAQLAASVVDGDLHRQLLAQENYSPDLYARALAPLVRFHSADPEIFYVYTMVERDGGTFFVLDTATSADLRSSHSLRGSGYMERFTLRKEYESDWLTQIAAGKTWVTPSFQQDDYGNFLSAHSPIFDSQGVYSGFVGVDFDLQYYLAQEARFRGIALGSVIAVLVASILIGYLAALYHFSLQNRVEEHYRISIRDGLTGLLNRRGAMDAFRKALARGAPSYAMLLVDIDELKSINDTHGHAAGDAVIAHVAEVIGQSIGDDHDCARLGGDEFMIFAPHCDQSGAGEIARSILSKLAPCARAPASVVLSVSIGIAVQEHGGADFDRMYREADVALYHAKSQGKNRWDLYQDFMVQPQEPHPSVRPAFGA